MGTKSTKAYVDLFGFKGLGLVAHFPSNVIYSNQVGGHLCRYLEAEGAFVPLGVDIAADLDEHFFHGPKWRGHCSGGIDDETANFLDELLRRNQLTADLHVDRNLMHLSCEAWINVKWPSQELSATSGIAEETQYLSGSLTNTGILTWENSD
jgi:hypothetical protein